MPDDDKTRDLHEVQIPKDKGERLEELGQRVIPPPPLYKVTSDDAIKGQRVPPPPSSPSPETPQTPAPQTPPTTATPQPPMPSPQPPAPWPSKGDSP